MACSAQALGAATHHCYTTNNIFACYKKHPWVHLQQGQPLSSLSFQISVNRAKGARSGSYNRRIRQSVVAPAEQRGQEGRAGRPGAEKGCSDK